MVNVLKAILKPAKVVLPTKPKISRPLLSAPVAESMKDELAMEVIDSPKNNLDLKEAVVSKIYTITDALKEEKEEAKSSKIEGSKGEITTVVIEKEPIILHEYINWHASGGRLTVAQIVVQDYAKDLKYPSSSLVYGGNDENGYLYCLPDNMELEVCHEMMDIMDGLSAMPKDQLMDCLAYNNLKVSIFAYYLL
jgi:hypothetical protein